MVSELVVKIPCRKERNINIVLIMGALDD